jgi:DNA-directed RNA polymerase specialized sigma24 family protein
MRRDALLAELANQRGRALVGYAFLLPGELAEAEDLAQEALVRTMLRVRGGAELKDARSAEAYVRRAIASLYVDGYRRRRRWLAAVPVAMPRASASCGTVMSS